MAPRAAVRFLAFFQLIELRLFAHRERAVYCVIPRLCSFIAIRTDGETTFFNSSVEYQTFECSGVRDQMAPCGSKTGDLLGSVAPCLRMRLDAP